MIDSAIDNKMLSELDKHTITKVENIKLETKFPRHIGKNAFIADHGYGSEMYAKVISTDKGARGWGYCHYFGDEDLKKLDHQITGKRLCEIFSLDNGTIDEFELYDIALYDLTGVILNQPVYKLLGGKGVASPDCYSGSVYMSDINDNGSISDIKNVINDCLDDWNAGYRALKIKLGRSKNWMTPNEGIRRDIDIVNEIRKILPESVIMVDFNNSATIEQIKLFIKNTADAHVYWIEEPIIAERENFLRIKEYLSKYSPYTLIADGESDPDIELLLSLASEGLLDVLQMDIINYGFSAWRKLIPRLKGLKAYASPHNWGVKVKTHYSAQFAKAYAQVNDIEGVLDETLGVDFSGYVMNNGKMQVPEKPGFGMTLLDRSIF